MRAKVLGIPIAAILATLVLAVPAFATALTYYDGYLNSAGSPYFGPRHTLTEVSVRTLSNFPASACTTAYETDGTRVFDPVCAYGYNGLATHVLCGCALRTPAVSSGGSYLRAQENY